MKMQEVRYEVYFKSTRKRKWLTFNTDYPNITAARKWVKVQKELDANYAWSSSLEYRIMRVFIEREFAE